MNERVDFIPFAWPGIAVELGFVPDPSAHEAACEVHEAACEVHEAACEVHQAARDDLFLRRDGSWLTLVDRGATDASAANRVDAPGLWRAATGEGEGRAFDLPPIALASDDFDLDADGRLAFRELIAWAEATRHGKPPAGWTLPDEECLDGVATTRLSVRAKSAFAEGELVREPERLAVVFPKLVEIPDALSPTRLAWIDELCRDTEARWKLVRIRAEHMSGHVSAAVDLTGAPHDCARSLLQLSLEALACAVEWILPSLALVVDPTAACRALERAPVPRSKTQPTRRNRK